MLLHRRLVLWEALACEVPALVRAIPIYRDGMPDGVLTHQVAGDGPGFPGRAAEKLTALLDGELNDLRRAGREAAESVDIQQIARTLGTLYEEVGAHPHRPAAGREG